MENVKKLGFSRFLLILYLFMSLENTKKIGIEYRSFRDFISTDLHKRVCYLCATL